MSQILKDIYYNYVSVNQEFVRDSEYGKTINNLCETEERLLQLLDGDEKILLEQFSNTQGDLNRISTAEGFTTGFKLGMQIAVEVFFTEEQKNIKRTLE